MELKDVHNANALFPMLVIPVGMLTDRREAQFRKAMTPMD